MSIPKPKLAYPLTYPIGTKLRIRPTATADALYSLNIDPAGAKNILANNPLFLAADSFHGGKQLGRQQGDAFRNYVVTVDLLQPDIEPESRIVTDAVAEDAPPVNRLDEYLIDVFQRTSNGLQSLTGKTCFWYARWCLGISTVFGVVYNHVIPTFIFGDVVEILQLVIFLLIFFIAERSTRNGMMNCERRHDRYMFRYFLIATACSAAFFCASGAKGQSLYVLERIFFLCGNYFSACQPGPKNTSKIRKAVEKLTALFNSVPAPSPA